MVKNFQDMCCRRKGVSMQRFFVLMCCSVVLLLLVSACEGKEDDEVDLGVKFINELYNIDDSSFDVNKMNAEQLIDYQNKFSTYFTEKEFNNLANKRFFLIPQEVASKQDNEIFVQNIVLKKADRGQKENNSIDFDLSFTLIFMNNEGENVDETEIKGQMSIVNTEKGLKIDRYYDGEILNDMLYR